MAIGALFFTSNLAVANQANGALMIKFNLAGANLLTFEEFKDQQKQELFPEANLGKSQNLTTHTLGQIQACFMPQKGIQKCNKYARVNSYAFKRI